MKRASPIKGGGAGHASSSFNKRPPITSNRGADPGTATIDTAADTSATSVLPRLSPSRARQKRSPTAHQSRKSLQSSKTYQWAPSAITDAAPDLGRVNRTGNAAWTKRLEWRQNKVIPRPASASFATPAAALGNVSASGVATHDDTAHGRGIILGADTTHTSKRAGSRRGVKPKLAQLPSLNAESSHSRVRSFQLTSDGWKKDPSEFVGEVTFLSTSLKPSQLRHEGLTASSTAKVTTLKNASRSTVGQETHSNPAAQSMKTGNELIGNPTSAGEGHIEDGDGAHMDTRLFEGEQFVAPQSTPHRVQVPPIAPTGGPPISGMRGLAHQIAPHEKSAMKEFIENVHELVSTDVRASVKNERDSDDASSGSVARPYGPEKFKETGQKPTEEVDGANVWLPPSVAAQILDPIFASKKARALSAMRKSALRMQSGFRARRGRQQASLMRSTRSEHGINQESSPMTLQAAVPSSKEGVAPESKEQMQPPKPSFILGNDIIASTASWAGNVLSSPLRPIGDVVDPLRAMFQKIQFAMDRLVKELAPPQYHHPSHAQIAGARPQHVQIYAADQKVLLPTGRASTAQKNGGAENAGGSLSSKAQSDNLRLTYGLTDPDSILRRNLREAMRVERALDRRIHVEQLRQKIMNQQLEMHNTAASCAATIPQSELKLEKGRQSPDAWSRSKKYSVSLETGYWPPRNDEVLVSQLSPVDLLQHAKAHPIKLHHPDTCGLFRAVWMGDCVGIVRLVELQDTNVNVCLQFVAVGEDNVDDENELLPNGNVSTHGLFSYREWNASLCQESDADQPCTTKDPTRLNDDTQADGALVVSALMVAVMIGAARVVETLLLLGAKPGLQTPVPLQFGGGTVTALHMAAFADATLKGQFRLNQLGMLLSVAISSGAEAATERRFTDKKGTSITRMVSAPPRLSCLHCSYGRSQALLAHTVAFFGLLPGARQITQHYHHASALVRATTLAGVTPVFVAAAQGHDAVLALFLRVAGVDVDATSAGCSGASPLYAAAQAGHYECARQLVHAGAMVDRAADFGMTALGISICTGAEDPLSSPVLRQLRPRPSSAKPLPRPMHRSNHTRSASASVRLSADAPNGEVTRSISQLLIEFGNTKTVRNVDGFTVPMLAALLGDFTTLTVLEKAGMIDYEDRNHEGERVSDLLRDIYGISMKSGTYTLHHISENLCTVRKRLHTPTLIRVASAVFMRFAERVNVQNLSEDLQGFSTTLPNQRNRSQDDNFGTRSRDLRRNRKTRHRQSLQTTAARSITHEQRLYGVSSVWFHRKMCSHGFLLNRDKGMGLTLQQFFHALSNTFRFSLHPQMSDGDEQASTAPDFGGRESFTLSVLDIIG
eukprot:INCI6209.2.p1 GENE.INCI6209.2~~INCI6209.2.p1  ORF type:complete len:1348 (-),score=183.21 INCI6209.2:659-4702(-)